MIEKMSKKEKRFWMKIFAIVFLISLVSLDWFIIALLITGFAWLVFAGEEIFADLNKTK